MVYAPPMQSVGPRLYTSFTNIPSIRTAIREKVGWRIHDVLSALEKRRFARESLLVTQITLYGQT